MRSFRTWSVLALTAGVLIASAPLLAQSASGGPAAPAPQGDMQQQVEQLRQEFQLLQRQYDERIAALEAQLAALRGQAPQGGAAPAGAAPGVTAAAGEVPPNAPPPATPGQAAAGAPQQPTATVPSGAEGAGGPSGALPVYGAATAGSKIFNPDIAVIGDFLGAAGKNDIQPDPFGPGSQPNALQMHESEASFQAIVDPYARADFFLSFGEEGVELEEGYVTFTSLPGGLLTRVGKMRAAFGKVNTLHNHVLPWADRPLVSNNLVGGEDGISDAGFSVARLIPNRWLFLEATGQVFRGDSGPDERPLYRTSQRSDLSYVGHLRAYQDLTDNANIDFGFSASRGHNEAGVVSGADIGRFTTTLFGVDATYRWRPLQRSIYHSFVGRAEVIWSRRDQFGGLQRAMGYYASGDYQLGRRWFLGARYDRSDRAENAAIFDRGGSVIVTYWPSEFAQVRGQYRRTTYAEGPTADEMLFQFQFSIGAHGAHPF